MQLDSVEWPPAPAWYHSGTTACGIVFGIVFIGLCLFIVFTGPSSDKKEFQVSSFVISITTSLAVGLLTSGIVLIFYAIPQRINEWTQQDIAAEKNITDSTAKMEKYFGISDISHDDNYHVVMLSYMNTDTHNLSSSDKKLVRIWQEDDKKNTDISTITFTQNGKEYAGTIKSHAGVIQVFRNDGTILKPAS